MKKILSLIIAAAMMLTMFSLTAFASGASTEPLGLSFYEWDTGVSILDGAYAPDYRQCSSTIRDNSAGFFATQYVDDVYDLTPTVTGNSSVKDHVLKLCGELLYTHGDTDFGTHFVTRADVRKGDMVDNSFAGVVVNYSSADGVGNLNRLRTAYAYDNNEQGYAFQSGYGFTFLADNDNVIRFYARCLAEDHYLDAIYFDYDCGYDVTKQYTEVYIYTDLANGGNVFFYVNDQYAGKLVIDTDVTHDFNDVPGTDSVYGVTYLIDEEGMTDDYDNTFGGTYYTKAAIYDADGLVDSTEDARINTGIDAGTPYGTLELVSTNAGSEIFVDQLDAMDFVSLPSIGETAHAAATVDTAAVDIEGSKIILNIALKAPQTMMSNDYGQSGFLDWSNPRTWIGREAIPAFFRVNTAKYTLKLVADSGEVYDAKLADGVFVSDPIDLSLIGENFNIQVFCDDTAVSVYEGFSVKEYLESLTDDQLAKDILALGAALDVYKGGEGFDVDGASAALETAPAAPAKSASRNSSADYIQGATLLIDEDLNIAFTLKTTNATSVVISADGYEDLIVEDITDRYAMTADIALADLATAFTADLMVDDTGVASATYCALNYICKNYNNANANLAAVCQRLYAVYADLNA